MGNDVQLQLHESSFIKGIDTISSSLWGKIGATTCAATELLTRTSNLHITTIQQPLSGPSVLILIK